MQSFASPPPLPIPHTTTKTTRQKSRPTIHATPPHRKGATIAYTHALST